MSHASVVEPADRMDPGGRQDRSDQWLLAQRRKLERHREFRREQLAHLETPAAGTTHPPPANSAGEPTENPALHEVAASVAAGARAVLTNIEEALAGLADGRYELCRACQAGIPLPVLEAIPETVLCLDCQHSFAQGQPSAVRHRPSGHLRRSRRTRRRPRRHHHGL